MLVIAISFNCDSDERNVGRTIMCPSPPARFVTAATMILKFGASGSVFVKPPTTAGFAYRISPAVHARVLISCTLPNTVM